MFYVISPPDTTDWHLDGDAFSRDLVERWPNVTFHPPEPDYPTRLVVWSIPDPEGGDRWLDGSLDHAGQAHYLRGNLVLAAEYAGWLRRKIPGGQPLVFTDETFTNVVELIDDGSAVSILEHYAAP